MKFFSFLLLIITWITPLQCSDSFQIHDRLGRLIEESFPNSKSVKIHYDEKNRVVQLEISNDGSIFYKYDDHHLLEVSRVLPNGEIAYTHSYEYDSSGGLLKEHLISNLGTLFYKKDLSKRTLQAISPYSQEVCQFDLQGQMISHSLDEKTYLYHYDEKNQLILDENETPIDTEYNVQGRLIKKRSPRGTFDFEYDDRGRLVQAISDQSTSFYTYDESDRRIKKRIQSKGKEKVETSLYFGKNEIAIYDEKGNLKQLRIPGLSFHDQFVLPIALEIDRSIFASLHDQRGNLFKCINTETKEVFPIPYIGSFGENLSEISPPTPWIFSAKHYDPETNLIYFGKRYYDPDLKEWITPDPLGTLQDQNVYLYCLNNPLLYFDPDGQFAISLVSIAWGVGTIVSFPAWGTAGLVIATGAVAGWATSEVIQKVKERRLSETTTQQEEKTREYKKPKSGISKKAGSKDVPSWAEGEKPYKNESGKDFAKRLLDKRHGKGNYEKGAKSDFNRLKKYADRSYE